MWLRATLLLSTALGAFTCSTTLRVPHARLEPTELPTALALVIRLFVSHATQELIALKVQLQAARFVAPERIALNQPPLSVRSANQAATAQRSLLLHACHPVCLDSIAQAQASQPVLSAHHVKQEAMPHRLAEVHAPYVPMEHSAQAPASLYAKHAHYVMLPWPPPARHVQMEVRPILSSAHVSQGSMATGCHRAVAHAPFTPQARPIL